MQGETAVGKQDMFASFSDEIMAFVNKFGFVPSVIALDSLEVRQDEDGSVITVLQLT